MNPTLENKVYEISADVKLLASELRGRGGLYDRIETLEKIQIEHEKAYWKGIGVIAGISAASAFIGSFAKYLF